jgi:hypothetical protein
MADSSKFIQIAASPNGLYALDESGDVWEYHSDLHGRDGKWTRLEKRDKGKSRPNF